MPPPPSLAAGALIHNSAGGGVASCYSLGHGDRRLPEAKAQKIRLIVLMSFDKGDGGELLLGFEARNGSGLNLADWSGPTRTTP